MFENLSYDCWELSWAAGTWAAGTCAAGSWAAEMNTTTNPRSQQRVQVLAHCHS